MHNIKAKFAVDVFILVTIFLTFAVAVNDLFAGSTGTFSQIRGSFLFVAALIGEELMYYISTGIRYKKNFLTHTILFLIELVAMGFVFFFMISNFQLNTIWCWVITVLLMAYPIKNIIIVGQDLYNLYNYLF